MSDYYNEQQVERFEKEAYDAAMGEAGREADRAKAKYMEYAWNIEQENIQLKQRIAELESKLERYRLAVLFIFEGCDKEVKDE